MILVGKVKSGLGEASYWMEKAETAFEKKIGIKPFRGTLNVELDKEFIFNEDSQVLHKEEYGGALDVYIKECEILGNKSYILRPERNMRKNADHPLNIIEVISNVNFREKYSLKDNDEIQIIIF